MAGARGPCCGRLFMVGFQGTFLQSHAKSTSTNALYTVMDAGPHLSHRCCLPRHNAGAWYLQVGRAAKPPANGWASPQMGFRQDERDEMEPAPPQTLLLAQCREGQVTWAWQCKHSGYSCLSPKIGVRKEITNLIFIAPAERCKSQELSAASRPIRPLGPAARLGFVGTRKFPAFPRPISSQPAPSLPAGWEHLPGVPAKARLRDVVPVPAGQSGAGDEGNRFEQQILMGTDKPCCFQVPRSLLDPFLCS